MGDSGAYFFGFVLAATSMLGGLKVTTVFSLFPTLLFLFLPLLDTVMVIVRRLFERKNPISNPGKDHLHHRLLARGLSPARTVTVLLIVTMAANILAMAIQGLSALVIVVTTIGILALLALVAWARRRALRRTIGRPGPSPLAANAAGDAAGLSTPPAALDSVADSPEEGKRIGSPERPE
jgi:UDP-GlcNAc:undecaprenyl-phosphate GlcNAc-1-phosphate transferase